MKPLISIILPSYNHASYVGQAIESVLNQTFTDYELLISDDASTDGTQDVINKYHDRRIRTHFFQTNQGATINHKYLIEQASGEYIALINSDDLWTPHKLELQVSYLSSDPNCGACFSWADFIDEYNNPIHVNNNVFVQPNRSQSEWLKSLFINGNCLCHPSMVIRKRVYDEWGIYNLALRQLPDFDMWVRLVKHYPIHIVEKTLVLHRRFLATGENTSAPKLTNSIRDVMESYYILTTFFNDLSDDLFINAFQPFFRNKSSESHQELLCEKFFLLMDCRYYLPAISKQAAITFLISIYSLPEMARLFRDMYGFTMQDFHALSCQVDLLGLIPVGVSINSDQDFDPEAYIKANKAKTLATIFFNKQSKLYCFLKKEYLKYASKHCDGHKKN